MTHLDLTHNARPLARTRRVDISSAATDCAAAAARAGTYRAICRHGGAVANAYGYAAHTQIVLAVSDPHGNVVTWGGNWIPANKVTRGGAAEAALAGARPLFDGRYGVEAERAAWVEIKSAHARAMGMQAAATLPSGIACVSTVRLPRRVRQGLRARRVAADLRPQAAALGWVRAFGATAYEGGRARMAAIMADEGLDARTVLADSADAVGEYEVRRGQRLAAGAAVARGVVSAA